MSSSYIARLVAFGLSSLMFLSCERTTTEYIATVSCLETFDFLSLTLENTEDGTLTELEVGDDGTVLFQDIQDVSYVLRASVQDPDLPYASLGYQQRFEGEHIANSVQLNLPRSPDNINATYTSLNEVEEMTFTWTELNCLFYSTLNVYSSDEWPFELTEANLVATEPFGWNSWNSAVINADDVNDFVVMEYEYSDRWLEFKVRTPPINKYEALNNYDKLSIGESMDFELQAGLGLYLDVELEEGGHYLVEYWDSINSELSGQTLVVNMDDYFMEGRTGPSQGSGRYFIAKESGLTRIHAQIGFPGQDGDFRIKCSRIDPPNVVDWSDSVDLTGSSQTLVMKREFEAGHHIFYSTVKNTGAELPIHYGMYHDNTNQVVASAWTWSQDLSYIGPVNDDVVQSKVEFDLDEKETLTFLILSGYAGQSNTLEFDFD